MVVLARLGIIEAKGRRKPESVAALARGLNCVHGRIDIADVSSRHEIGGRNAGSLPDVTASCIERVLPGVQFASDASTTWERTGLPGIWSMPLFSLHLPL
jgi:hypothetical protein